MFKASSNTRTILQHWMDFRLKLVFEGIAIGALSGGIIILYRISLEKADVIRDNIFFLLHKTSKWWIFVLFLSILLISYLLGVIVKKEPMISGSGIPQVKGQLSNQFKINWIRVIIGKFFGGILAIGAGLSLGREGPSIQLGASVGQGMGYTLGRQKLENKYLITCGASAGLAAAFNAPLAGVIFALEEMHKNFSPIVLSSAMAASLTADFISQQYFGHKPIFTFHALPALPLNHFPHIIVLGVIMGILGVFFNKALIKTLDFYKKLPILQEMKPALPLILAGILGFVLPQVLGGGHNLVNSLSTNNIPLTMLIVLVIVKFIFTMLSYGSGVPGGIFLPLLVIGALTGNIYGNITNHYFNVDPQYINNFVVLAMAGYFSAIIKAPITGSILITEMTGSFTHLLTLSTVSIVAYIVTDLMNSHPIYDTLLERLLTNKESSQYAGNKHTKVILETVVCLGSQIEHQRIKDIQWPKDCLLVGIVRGEKEIIPKGNTIIEVGDYLIALTNENKEVQAREILQSLAGECQSYDM